ncbi:MAG: hypothetical protein QOF19_2633 [Alphaproteobacteria bacterium]|nr:hypothetical protein [Alphaproteobacteria bacterium]
MGISILGKSLVVRGSALDVNCSTYLMVHDDQFIVSAGGNMDKRSKHQPATRAKTKLGLEQSDIFALLQLLLSARISAESDSEDGICAKLIEQCILHLMRTHCLSQSDVGLCLTSAEVIPRLALLHVLTYARLELLRALDDRFCADLLEQCISQLTDDYRVPPAISVEAVPRVSH